MACSTVPGIDNLASTLISYIDCQTSVMATRGYGALTASGGLVPSLLLAVITLYIAVWGYRLLMGDRPNPSEILPSIARVAIVLTLAFSWPAYQRLVYDVVLQTPAQVAGAVDLSETGRDDGLGLAARLDDIDARFVRLTILGAGTARTPEEAAFARANVPPPLFLNFDTFALGSARLVFLVSAVGSFALVRLLSGALLALGPVVIMFLLFETTRGLVAGWARSLVGLVVAGVVTILMIDIETLLFAPWLGDLLAQRGAEQPIYGASAQLLAAATIFSIVIFAGIRIGQRLMVAFWPANRVPSVARQAEEPRSTNVVATSSASPIFATVEHAQHRARAVAEAITASDHRRTRLSTADAVSGSVVPAGASTAQVAGWTGTSSASTIAGRRRTGARGSASSARRDRR